MKRFLKIIGVIALLIAMGYASNWDLPKEDKTIADFERVEPTKVVIGDDVYEGVYLDVEYYVEIDGERIYGQVIDGMWYEPLELIGGAIPDEFMENSDDE